MPHLLAVLTALVVTVLVPACAGTTSPPVGPPPPDAAARVDIRNIAFNPMVVTVAAGSTVAWKFDDGSIAHNVTGAGWASPDRTSGYFTHTFSTPGVYAYRCTIHSNMDGTVVVTS